jgi:hypothetical protein
MLDVLPGPELTDDVDRLLEHLEPLRRGGPTFAGHVFVEVLPRPHAEEESAGHHGGGRRGRLCDERRMHPDQRTRDAGPDTHPVRHRGDATQDAPHEGALALPRDPGMEMVRDQREREPRSLGGRRMPDQLGRLVLLS